MTRTDVRWDLQVPRSIAVAFALVLSLGGCAGGSSAPWSSWGEQASYHALAVMSQYQEQLNVVVARISMPGATPEDIEQKIAIPLEYSVGKLSSVKSVRTRSEDGRFLMEVRFKRPAVDEQLSEVKRVVDGFWVGQSTTLDAPTVILDKASIL